MNKTLKFIFLISILFILITPVASFAQEQDEGKGLVPCATDRTPGMCGFKDFMLLINNIVDFIFKFLALPIVAIMSAYAGFSMVSSGGSPESRSKAKSILWDAIIGFLLVGCSWLVVKTLLSLMGYGDIGLFF